MMETFLFFFFLEGGGLVGCVQVITYNLFKVSASFLRLVALAGLRSRSSLRTKLPNPTRKRFAFNPKSASNTMNTAKRVWGLGIRVKGLGLRD